MCCLFLEKLYFKKTTEMQPHFMELHCAEKVCRNIFPNGQQLGNTSLFTWIGMQP